VNGIKAEPTPDSLAWGISNVINDPSKAEMLGMRGRAKVDRMFQWNPVASQMEKTYARAVY
ncbi:MAG: glycosyltransferase family 1 protein, partial [Methanoregula sp.]